MKVLICLSLFVAVTLALHLPVGFQRPPRPLPEIEHDHDHSFPRPQPPHFPEDMHPELKEFLEDIFDFLKILPHRELKMMVKKAFKHDEELRQTVKYMRSPAFVETMKQIGELPEVVELFQPFVDHHIETQDLASRALDVIDEELDVETLPGVVTDDHTGGLCALIDRMIAILPHEQLRELHREKVAKGGVFAEVVAFLTSDKFQQSLERVFQSERFRELDATLREHGVCLDKFVELPMNVLGFH